MSTTPTPPPSPEQLYLQSGFDASSGVDAALLDAAPGTNITTNAITEQLQNLQLPATQSLFEPADYWDYTNYAALSQSPAYSGITATGDTTGATYAVPSSAEATLESFSLFGLGPVESWLIVAGAIYLLLGKSKSHGRGI